MVYTGMVPLESIQIQACSFRATTDEMQRLNISFNFHLDVLVQISGGTVQCNIFIATCKLWMQLAMHCLHSQC